MDSLRLTLVVIGLITVIGLYFKFRSSEDDFTYPLKKLFNFKFKNNHSLDEMSSDEEEFIPVLTPLQDEPDSSDFAALSQVISGHSTIEKYTKQDELTFTAVEESLESGPDSLLIVLNIMSPKGQYFTGEGINAVMKSAGLSHGEHKIYHYIQNSVSVFSIANAIEPGFFDLEQLENIATPGLAIFMALPGPLECRKAFDTLINISKKITEALGGELCDEKRSALTQQSISHLNEKIEDYRLKQQAFQRRKHQ
ncbi:MAG: cell division protein ZipA C-terminal FtsZ-binding domain-containing protein [Woeseiaceae bacterium]